MIAKQSKKAETIGAEALLKAADTVEQWVDNEKDHYKGYDETPCIGPENTYRRAFNAADKYAVESEATGDKFDSVVDCFGDVIAMAKKHDIDGKDAAEFYRNKAKNILD